MQAFETFVELEPTFGLKPTTEVYNTLMEGCCRNGKPETVLQLFEEMKVTDTGDASFRA